MMLTLPEPRKSWHRGELSIQNRLGVAAAVAQGWTWYKCGLHEEHRVFNTTRLSFVPLTTVDRDGRPWVSILCARDDGQAEAGLVSSPDEMTMVVDFVMRDGDPLAKTLKEGGDVVGQDRYHLVAGLGIEFASRTRNKFAGFMKVDTVDAEHYKLKLTVNQAIGNCPKYITIRSLVPHTCTPRVIHDVWNLPPTAVLPDDVISFIHRCDTTFLGTTFRAADDEEFTKTPSHLGLNHRGGRPGFIRVREDRRTVVMPDYSGDRLLTSLGNIDATPLASLTFISFSTGDVLYLTGHAVNLVGSDARAVMPLQDTLTTIEATGYVFVASALPLREAPGAAVERSPYSPPVKYLAEEEKQRARLAISTTGPGAAGDEDDARALLKKVTLHAPSLATFEFESARPVRVVPGQAVIMDFSSLVGRVEWSHMRDEDPQGLNDERIRTWTVSGADTWDAAADGGDGASTKRFALTMREKQGGVITGALFAIARKLKEKRPELLDDSTPIQLSAKVLGVGGDFVLPPPNNQQPEDRVEQFLWVAGGVGITPFLAMLSGLVNARRSINEKHIHFVISTREPEILLPLISQALAQREGVGEQQPRIMILLDVFSPTDAPAYDDVLPRSKPSSVAFTTRKHVGRITDDFFKTQAMNAEALENTTIFLCGPESFESRVVSILGAVGVSADRIKREDFDY